MGIMGPKPDRNYNGTFGRSGGTVVVPRRLSPQHLAKLEHLKTLAAAQQVERRKAKRLAASASAASAPESTLAKHGSGRGKKLPPLDSPARRRSTPAAATMRAATPEMAVDWKTLAACEVVLDHEDEKRRKREAKAGLEQMRLGLDDQLKTNAERRALEREQKLKWSAEVRAQTLKAQTSEREEVAAREAKRKEVQSIFAEQALEQKAAREREKRLRDAEAKALLDAAKKSLDEDREKELKASAERKKQQDRLQKELTAEHALKAQRRLDEWAENERIAREANARADEIERRRADAVARREQTIQKFEQMHAAGAGRKASDDERAAIDLAARHQYEKAVRDAEADKTKNARRAAALDEARRENESQVANKRREADRARAFKALEKETADQEMARLRQLDEAKHRDRLAKQRHLQQQLADQVSEQKSRRSRDHAAQAMSDTEVALNRDIVATLLADPTQKDELKSLLFNKMARLHAPAAAAS